MSSPATATFLEHWRNNVTRAPRALAKIEIASPSPVTLYVATAETFLPDGTVWEAGLKADRIRAEIDRLGSGPNLCDTAIHLANRLYSALPGGLLCELAADYQWQDALVTLYLWNDVRDPASGAQRLTAADLLQVFQGTVDAPEWDDSWLHLQLLQDRAWNRPLSLRRIDKANYPNAPDGQFGLIEPVLYGDFGAFGLRSPWATAFGYKQTQEDCGGGSGVVPLILVDPGTGLTSAKLLAAGHECVKLKDRANGYSTFVDAGDVVAPIDAAGLTESLGAGGSYLLLASNAFQAYFGLRAIDVRTDAGRNTALNPRRAMDVLDETSCADLDQSTSNGVLELVIPSQGGQGYIEAVQIYVAFIGAAANTHNLRVYPFDHGAAVSGTVVQSAATGTVPAILSGTWDAGFWTRPWRFAESASHAGPIDFRVDFAGGTTNRSRILFVAARVKYRPDLSIVTPDVTYRTRVKDTPPPGQGGVGGGWRWSHLESRVVSGIKQVVGSFFGNVKGYADDSSGTFAGEVLDLPNGVCTAGGNSMSYTAAPLYVAERARRVSIGDIVLASPPGYAQWFPVGSVVTGITNNGYDLQFNNVASGSSLGPFAFVRIQTRGHLIERPPDIAHHFLATYAGATNFETDDAAFGSFVRARALLRNSGPTDFRMAARISDPSTTGEVLSRICDQSLSAALLDRFSGKWLFLPWIKGRAVDYDYVLTREDCADLFQAGIVSDVNLVQGVRVKYAFDHFRGRTLFEAFVNSEGSSGGYSQATARDQRLVVDSTNNKLDWQRGGTTDVRTLTSGAYDAPIDLAAEVQTQLRGLLPGSPTLPYIAAGFGCHIKAGFNDALEFWYGTTYYNTTIAAGGYSPDEFAAVVAARMNQVAGVSAISCVYDQLSNRFIYTSSGLGIGFVAKGSAHCLSPGSSAIWVLGFGLAAGSGASNTTLIATWPIYRDRFWIASETTFYPLAGSGANVGNGCWGLLGFDAVDGTSSDHQFARLARGIRESVSAASEDAYGSRPDSEMEAEWIRDELAAQQLRDRAFDFGGVPPAWLRIRTHAVPDLQRLRVVSLDATCDARRRFPRYGSDGSWAAKGMCVLQVEQDMGPSFHTEFYAEEA